MELKLTSKNVDFNKYFQKSFGNCQTDDEKACIIEEYKFFQKNHWEEYYNLTLLMYSQILTDKYFSVFETSGTATLSYMISTFFGGNDIEFMNNKDRIELVHNYRLGFDLEISKKNFDDDMSDEIEDLVQVCASKNNLIYTHQGMTFNIKGGEEVIVMAISKKPLTERDSQAISHELLSPNVSKEDEDLLRDIFLVKVFLH